MIQDSISVTKPTRVLIGVERISDEVKRATIIDEVVAEWWVSEGSDIVLEPWIEHGIRTQGWKLTRRSGVHVVPEVESGVGLVRWHQVAQDMAEALGGGGQQSALDVYELAVMQNDMATTTEPERHEHQFVHPGVDPSEDRQCTITGCTVTYGNRWEQ